MSALCRPVFNLLIHAKTTAPGHSALPNFPNYFCILCISILDLTGPYRSEILETQTAPAVQQHSRGIQTQAVHATAAGCTDHSQDTCMSVVGRCRRFIDFRCLGCVSGMRSGVPARSDRHDPGLNVYISTISRRFCHIAS